MDAVLGRLERLADRLERVEASALRPLLRMGPQLRHSCSYGALLLLGRWIPTQLAAAGCRGRCASTDRSNSGGPGPGRASPAAIPTRAQVNLSTGGSDGVPLSRSISTASSVSSASVAPAGDPVAAFDAFLAEYLLPVTDASSTLGGEVRPASAPAAPPGRPPAPSCQLRPARPGAAGGGRARRAPAPVQVASLTACVEKAFKAVRQVLATAARAKVSSLARRLLHQPGPLAQAHATSSCSQRAPSGTGPSSPPPLPPPSPRARGGPALIWPRLAAPRAQQPSQQETQALVGPVGEQIMAAQKIGDDRRTRAVQHAKVVTEALQGMSWLLYSGPSCGGWPPRVPAAGKAHAQSLPLNRPCRAGRCLGALEPAQRAFCMPLTAQAWRCRRSLCLTAGTRPSSTPTSC
jgi:hypothetical protein